MGLFHCFTNISWVYFIVIPTFHGFISRFVLTLNGYISQSYCYFVVLVHSFTNMNIRDGLKDYERMIIEVVAYLVCRD
jgi:hypothetical protein